MSSSQFRSQPPMEAHRSTVICQESTLMAGDHYVTVPSGSSGSRKDPVEAAGIAGSVERNGGPGPSGACRMMGAPGLGERELHDCTGYIGTTFSRAGSTRYFVPTLLQGSIGLLILCESGKTYGYIVHIDTAATYWTCYRMYITIDNPFLQARVPDPKNHNNWTEGKAEKSGCHWRKVPTFGNPETHFEILSARLGLLQGPCHMK